MKKVSSVRLGLAFAGSFLGAGYVSGQELWQFFGRFGSGMLPGLVLAMVLIGVFGVMIMEMARQTGIVEMDRLVVEKESPLLRGTMSALQAVMLFGFVVIMCAGGGALCSQQWGLSAVVSGTAFVVCVWLLSLMGLSGLVNLFSALVPVLSVVSAAAGIAVLVMQGGLPPAAATAEDFGGWVVSAVVFFAYNTFGVIGIVIPMGMMAEDSKSIRRSVLLGCVMLSALAVSVLMPMRAVPGSENAELPLLMIINAYLPGLAPWYAVLLLSVMLGSSLACLMALVTFLKEKFEPVRSHGVLWTAVIMTAALLASFGGFSDLIGIIYPVFGYCGFGFLALLVLHWFHWKKERAV